MTQALDDVLDKEDRTSQPVTITVDTIMPADMALRAEAAGVRRASMDHLTVLVLGVLAGAFISFGAHA